MRSVSGKRYAGQQALDSRSCKSLERAVRVKGGGAGARGARTLDAHEHSKTIALRRIWWVTFGEQEPTVLAR